MFYGELMTDANDVAYYGDRVAARHPHAVLMRWRTSDDNYRVVFGDLRVRSAGAGELADLEARPLNVNPYAVEPQPADRSSGVPLENVRLAGRAGAGARQHRVYFGTDPDALSLLATIDETQYGDLPPLERGTAYFWHIDEIDANGTLTPGSLWRFDTGDLIAHWTFDDGSGPGAADATGNGLDGTLMGETAWVEGIRGGGLEFDGDGDDVDVGTDAAFDITDRITVAAWVQVNAFDMDWQTIIAKGDTAWRLSRSQGDNLHFACTGMWPEWVHGQTNVNDGQWHHVAGVFDGSEIRLYVDGELDASAKTQGSINVNDHPVWIGGNPEHPGRAWNGRIDDVHIYTYALNAEEVERSHDEGDGTTTSRRR
jgi:hypothetical protein